MALARVDLIVHAGDIGSPDVLTRLAALAPVTAVRGNNDCGPWAEALPETEVVEVARTATCRRPPSATAGSTSTVDGSRLAGRRALR